MKNLICASFVLLFLTLSCQPSSRSSYGNLGFKQDILLKTTPIKQQGNSSLCWVYAMLATIETNHLMLGDSVNLSENYIARHLLQDELTHYYFSKGQSTLRLRGMGTRLLQALRTYGIVPYDAYHTTEPINYQALQKQLMFTARSAHHLKSLQRRGENILDENLGYPPPSTVYMLHAEYTPLEFAHSVCTEDEYQAITSFTHHPFYQSFALEVPDNILQDKAQNLPLDSMMQWLVNKLSNGRAVFWEGDISNEGFLFKDGIATTSTSLITQSMRQQAFETLQTTDDHAMELIGIAHDKTGKRFFIAKNSWGTNNKFHGFMYLSEDYIRLYTILMIG